WEKAGTLAWELKNLNLDEDSVRMFVAKFFPEFLSQYPLDRPESMEAWKDYLKEKQEKFIKICNDIETIDYPYFVYAEKERKNLCLSKAKVFFTKTGIDAENISMLDIAEIMQKHWRGWYSEKEDILTQVAFLDLQHGLMEGNIFICKNCRKLFLRPKRGPEPSFCSSRCQNQYYYRKRR
ncbi:MAG: hypothetical protein ACE5NG_15230, partial [bacterium]